jgi:hypothetical protein
VISNIFCFSLFKSPLFFETIHLLSQTIIFFIQYKYNNLIIAVQAAQRPLTIIFNFSFFLFVTFKEFIIQAKTTTAVQC